MNDNGRFWLVTARPLQIPATKYSTLMVNIRAAHSGFRGSEISGRAREKSAFGQLSGFRAASGRVGLRSGNSNIFGLGSGVGREIGQNLPECAALVNIYSDS